MNGYFLVEKVELLSLGFTFPGSFEFRFLYSHHPFLRLRRLISTLQSFWKHLPFFNQCGSIEQGGEISAKTRLQDFFIEQVNQDTREFVLKIFKFIN